MVLVMRILRIYTMVGVRLGSPEHLKRISLKPLPVSYLSLKFSDQNKLTLRKFSNSLYPQIINRELGSLSKMNQFMNPNNFSVTSLSSMKSFKMFPIYSVISSSSSSSSSSFIYYLFYLLIPDFIKAFSFYFFSLSINLLCWTSSYDSPLCFSIDSVNNPIIWMYFIQLRTTPSL